MCFYPCPILLPVDIEILSFDDFDSLLIQEFESHTEATASDSNPLGREFAIAYPAQV
jgi:hypothetical protein